MCGIQFVIPKKQTNKHLPQEQIKTNTTTTTKAKKKQQQQQNTNIKQNKTNPQMC